MNHTCTFIPTQHAKDLLCALFAEFQCYGQTRGILFALRFELGLDEFGRFQADLARLMKKYPARIAVRMIIEAAIQRDRAHYQSLKTTPLRGIYEYPHQAQQPQISRRFD